ncbi:DEAD-domain-containing protein [Catenaria anguillulae PL171]|uniref:RNA helicase n=1 Tax=Catenaria anguillulae PL171 TaxID=765915 RepID=A0A1Y2HKP1_9FUNG|nr:DEAD-domain-containing protein [Catenaria anguillulae PL171]
MSPSPSRKSRSRSRSASPSRKQAAAAAWDAPISPEATAAADDVWGSGPAFPEPATADADADAVADKVGAVSLSGNGAAKTEDGEVEKSKFGGLHETDFTADEIQITLAHGSDEPIQVANKFEDLDLPEPILKAIFDAGFNAPSIIQKKALPLLLADPPTNMIAQSRSGTGKTAAFVLTMLARADPNARATQAICLANTRELAIQIVNVVAALSKHSGHTVCMAVKDSIPRGTRISDHIVVGTPGTILDLLRRRSLTTEYVRVLVLDEADAMLDQQNMGVQSADVRKSIRHNPQVLLFSATFPDKVKAFAAKFAPEANILMLPREEVNVKSIHQFYITVQGREAKFHKLDELYALLNVGQSIIFVQRKADAYDLNERLTQAGHASTVITGEDLPADRDAIMHNFRTGNSKVLIATNVLARGIDVPQINLVVNYDMPEDGFGNPDHEAYMHRIGRTGRFGREGVSVNFIDGFKAEAIQSLVVQQYALDIQEMPEDFDEMEKMLKACRV